MPKRDFLTACLLRHAWLWTFMFLAVALWVPAVPIDETRYLTIAWEMHRSGDVVGLTLNGKPYLDKPPLLFWLINVAWYLFGQSVASARLVAVTFAAGTLALLASIERRLTGGNTEQATVAIWILLPFVLFATLGSSVMFDIPLCFFITASFLALVIWVRERRRWAPLLLFLTAASGMLVKGPVVFVHLIGPVLLMRWWHGPQMPHPKQSALAMIGVLLLSAIPLAWWATASAARIEHAPVADLLLHQAFGRVSDSFAHRRATWWYFIWLPLFMLPWSLWIRWTSLARGLRVIHCEEAGRFGAAACAPAFFLFSLISGKQLHYLLPLLPGIALCLAAIVRAEIGLIDHRRIRFGIGVMSLVCAWPLVSVLSDHGRFVSLLPALPSFGLLGVAALIAGRGSRAPNERQIAATSITSLCLVIALVLQLGFYLRRSHDADDLADAVHYLRRRNVPIIAMDDEPGMIGFLARLPSPLPVADREKAAAWAAEHPDGFVLVHGSKSVAPSQTHILVKLVNGWEGLVPADVVQRGTY